MDVADVILRRGSRPPLPALDSLFGDDGMDLDMRGEGIIYVIWQGHVPVVWPMTLHRHGQDCGHA